MFVHSFKKTVTISVVFCNFCLVGRKENFKILIHPFGILQSILQKNEW